MSYITKKIDELAVKKAALRDLAKDDGKVQKALELSDAYHEELATLEQEVAPYIAFYPAAPIWLQPCWVSRPASFYLTITCNAARDTTTNVQSAAPW